MLLHIPSRLNYVSPKLSKLASWMSLPLKNIINSHYVRTKYEKNGKFAWCKELPP
jgi:hypothetical protein